MGRERSDHSSRGETHTQMSRADRERFIERRRLRTRRNIPPPSPGFLHCPCHIPYDRPSPFSPSCHTTSPLAITHASQGGKYGALCPLYWPGWKEHDAPRTGSPGDITVQGETKHWRVNLPLAVLKVVEVSGYKSMTKIKKKPLCIYLYLCE